MFAAMLVMFFFKWPLKHGSDEHLLNQEVHKPWLTSRINVFGLFDPAGFAQGLSEHVFYLRIDTAQIISSPFLDC